MQSIKPTLQKEVPKISSMTPSSKQLTVTDSFRIIDCFVIDERTFGFRNYEVIPQTAIVCSKFTKVPAVNKRKVSDSYCFFIFYFNLGLLA